MSKIFSNIKMDYVTVNLGIVPTRRDIFPLPKHAIEHKKEIMPKLVSMCNAIHDVNVFTMDDILPDGLLCEECYVDIAEEYLRKNKVDALFFPHMNFGQEESVARLAKKLGIPVLLWGPRDGNPDNDENLRIYDTQCGMFATSRAFVRYGVPFTYIENSWIDSPVFKKGLEEFIRVASVVKALKGLRVLQISTRPRQFLSVKVNEGELLEKFGIEVTPVESSEIVGTVRKYLNDEADLVSEAVKELEELVEIEKASEQQKKNVAALALGMRELAEKYRCRTIASECWALYNEVFDIPPCLANAVLTQCGLPVSCECDINGAISNVIAQALTRQESPSFFADITVRHPHNDNAELMWHCGPFPPALAREKHPKSIDCQCYFELKKGTITLTRFDGSRGEYVLFGDTAEGVDGPFSTGSYVWVETRDWPAWERKLMYGPYVHHIAGVYGDFKDVIREATRYIDATFDSVD